MTVYVDSCIWPWRGRRWCHCISDVSYDELHAFVATMGVPREGFQGDHYDLDEPRRALAIESGAVAVNGRDVVRLLRDAGLRQPRNRRD